MDKENRSKIHINCDMAESFGRYILINDAELIPFVDACNIACGLHAGDPSVIDGTITLALEHGKQVGAHPGYPDLQGFGRRHITIQEDDLCASIKYQIGAIKSMIESHGGQLSHVKAHGALYNDAMQDVQVARALLRAIQKISPYAEVFGQPDSMVMSLAPEYDLICRAEGFLDRTYLSDGRLTPRGRVDAIIHDPERAWHQANTMWFQGGIKTVDGSDLSLNVDTICVHGDHPHALAILQHRPAS